MTIGLGVQNDGNVRILTLDHPATRNAIDLDLAYRLATELRDAEADPEVAAVILTGADPAFCSGVDFKALIDDKQGWDVMVDEVNSPWRALRAMSTTVIGAINGPAITGGLELALSCSFMVASERASFGDTYARIGMHPGGGLGTLLSEAIGVRRARELSATGRMMDAEEAYQYGLVNDVVPHANLMSFALEVARTVAATDHRMVSLLNDLYRDATNMESSLAVEEKAFRNRERSVHSLRHWYQDKVWKSTRNPVGAGSGAWSSGSGRGRGTTRWGEG